MLIPFLCIFVTTVADNEIFPPCHPLIIVSRLYRVSWPVGRATSCNWETEAGRGDLSNISSSFCFLEGCEELDLAWWILIASVNLSKYILVDFVLPWTIWTHSRNSYITTNVNERCDPPYRWNKRIYTLNCCSVVNTRDKHRQRLRVQPKPQVWTIVKSDRKDNHKVTRYHSPWGSATGGFAQLGITLLKIKSVKVEEATDLNA